MNNIDKFHDSIHALEQYRQFTGTPKAEILDSPDCVEVIGDMESLVASSPEIVDFYARVVKNYRPAKPEMIKEELDVIGERIGYMINDDLYSPDKETELKHQIETGEIAIEEAKVFFKMFKHVIPKENRPKIQRAVKPSTKPKKPRQSREINVAITEHSGISINGKYLRSLTPAQKLVILSGLYDEEGFRNVDIYNSPEFKKILEESQSVEEPLVVFTQEMENLKALLEKEGFSRLLDPNVKKHQRKHKIVAASVVDYRITPRSGTKPHRPATIEFRDDEDEIESGKQASSSEIYVQDVSDEEVVHARQLLVELLFSSDGVVRNNFVNTVAAQLGVDVRTARHIVTRVYANELAKDEPAFKQVKNGGKKFVRALQEVVNEPEKQEAFAEPYFSGTPEQFKQRFGEVKGVTPDFINYTRGVIKLTGIEQGILRHFDITGERKAVSEKSVITALGNEGIIATPAELRAACKLINTLAEKVFVRTMRPASRYSAVKGSRIQMVGAFMEVSN